MVIAVRVSVRATQPIGRRGDCYHLVTAVERSRSTCVVLRSAPAFIQHGTEPVARDVHAMSWQAPMSGFRRVRGQRQQVRTFAPAQRLQGQVHFAALNLQRRILGHRRLHFLRQETSTCLGDLQHDMGSVYRSRSERSNFLHSVFSEHTPLRRKLEQRARSTLATSQFVALLLRCVPRPFSGSRRAPADRAPRSARRARAACSMPAPGPSRLRILPARHRS